MCGRYYIAEEDSAKELQEIIDALNRREQSAPVKTSGEIFPTDVVPVLANNRRLETAAFAMKWGYTVPSGSLVINARSETAGEKPLFRDGMEHRRCVIPASHYFEWERRGREKTRYAIRPDGDGLMYMAGLYRIEGSGAAFTILTREAASPIAFIHPRMPVLLPQELLGDWLNPHYRADDVLSQASTPVISRQS